MNIIKLSEGIVQAKSLLGLGKQQELLNIANRSGLLWNPEYRVAGSNRQRLFGAIDAMPGLRDIAIDAWKETGAPEGFPTHFIMLWYWRDGFSSMPFHMDNGENDGIPDKPIMLLSVGDTARMLVCKEKPRYASVGPQLPSNLQVF